MAGKGKDGDKKNNKDKKKKGKKIYIVPALLSFGPLSLLTGKAFAASWT